MSLDRTDPARSYRAPMFAEAGSTPPRTVCAACPAALWYEAGGPIAFCTVMKMTTSPHPVTPITRCGGQRAALAKLDAEMRRPGAAR